jgi:transposase
MPIRFPVACLSFRSRSAEVIRILAYDGQGFWLATKRLSRGRFRWWPPGLEATKTLRAHQAQMLLAAGSKLRIHMPRSPKM